MVPILLIFNNLVPHSSKTPSIVALSNMQNKHQQRYSQPQYFHNHRPRTPSTNSNHQMLPKYNETPTFPSSVITRCALQLTTRLNTLENRMDALETIILQGRPETCTIDTLTARRLSGLKKRRRSKRIVSASLLDDINDVKHAQDGTNPRPPGSLQIQTVFGSRKNKNDSTIYGQCKGASFGEDECGEMILATGNTTIDMDIEVFDTPTEQVRKLDSSTSFRSSTLPPIHDLLVTKTRGHNLAHRLSKPTRNMSSASTAPSSAETICQHVHISNDANNASSRRPSRIGAAIVRSFNFDSPAYSSTKSISPQPPITTQQIQPQPLPNHYLNILSIPNFSKPLSIKPLTPRKPTPLPNSPQTHHRSISSTTTISSSTISTNLSSCSSPVRSTTSSISSVSYPATEGSITNDYALPEGRQDAEKSSSSDYVQVPRKQRILSREEFQSAIELWNFDVLERFRG